MSLIGLGLLKQSVSPVEVVQHPQHPVALVEPGGERRVVKAGVRAAFRPLLPHTCPHRADHMCQNNPGDCCAFLEPLQTENLPCSFGKLCVIAVHTSQNLWQSLACSGRCRDHLHQDPLEHLLKCRFPGPVPPSTDTWVPHTWSGTHEPAFEKHISGWFWCSVIDHT